MFSVRIINKNIILFSMFKDSNFNFKNLLELVWKIKKNTNNKLNASIAHQTTINEVVFIKIVFSGNINSKGKTNCKDHEKFRYTKINSKGFPKNQAKEIISHIVR